MTPPRRLRQPLAWYLGVTLGIPLAGGAPLEIAFLEHALTVLAVSAGVALAWTWLRPALARALPGRSASPPQAR